jgi:antibiotic biosynthesis monooxygenase (ABM) superfamily enzyme
MQEDNMAVEVIIKRTVKPGHLAKQLVPLLLKLRAMALSQPGYISGETLCNLDNPENCVVISRWETAEDWDRWVRSNERAAIEEKIEALTGEKTEYSVYAAMVPR